MTGTFHNICIQGISAAVPSMVEVNALAEEYLGARRCKKQIQLTGVEQRHVSRVDQKISDLCYAAARDLMKHLSWDPEEIKVLILLTQKPNYAAPSTAFLLQKLLHIPTDCIVFDVNLGCSGFNAGLQITASLLQQLPVGAKGLCLQGDMAYQTICPGTSPDAMASSLLFGSAGSAFAIEKVQSAEAIPYATFSDGNRYEAILKHSDKQLSMDGEGVFNFSTNDVVDSIKSFRQQNHLTEDDIDYYVLHQAQKLILDSMIMDCNIDPKKELRSVREYGNTSGASVPLSICANRDIFSDKKQVRILSCGFGVGLSWSMAYTHLDPRNILPVIISDNIYES